MGEVAQLQLVELGARLVSEDRGNAALRQIDEAETGVIYIYLDTNRLIDR